MKIVKNGLKKRKIKIFLIFLLCSSLAWFITKLSGTYTGSAVFDINYKNVPDSLRFLGASQEKIDVKLRASGFVFLGFNFGNKKVSIDVSKVQESNGNYVVPKKAYQLQIEQQLPTSMDLVSIYNDDDIVLELDHLYTKTIPVISNLEVALDQNFMIDNTVQIKPDSITVKGTKKELDNIKSVKTEAKKIENVALDFSEKLSVIVPENSKDIKFFSKEVTVFGKVVRFSEKIVEVPIKVINVPEAYDIKIFPNAISVLCKAKIDNLKQLKSSDFEIVADYNTVQDKNQQTILLELKSFPEIMNTPKLMVNEVRYILKRK